MKKKQITAPSVEAEHELDAVLDKTPTEVNVRGKVWRCYYLRKWTLRKMTHVVLTETDEDKVTIKCTALFRLNNFFLINLCYWFLWRYYYYVKEYTESELSAFLQECKKKVDVEGYLLNTILLIGMKDTEMMKAREEVERIRAEQLGDNAGASAKNSPNSSPQSTSSEG